MSLKLLDCIGTTIQEARGIGSVLLPILRLKNNEDDFTGDGGILVKEKVIRRKRLSTISAISDITYSKALKGFGQSDSDISSEKYHRKSLVSTESIESGHKGHKKRRSSGGSEIFESSEMESKNRVSVFSDNNSGKAF